MFFTTGSADFICPARTFVKPSYNKCNTAIYASLAGADHAEPTRGKYARQGGRMGPYQARFFQCHLNQDPAACDDVYGNGPNALKNAYKYAEFNIKGSPVLSPRSDP